MVVLHIPKCLFRLVFLMITIPMKTWHCYSVLTLIASACFPSIASTIPLFRWATVSLGLHLIAMLYSSNASSYLFWSCNHNILPVLQPADSRKVTNLNKTKNKSFRWSWAEIQHFEVLARNLSLDKDPESISNHCHPIPRILGTPCSSFIITCNW